MKIHKICGHAQLIIFLLFAVDLLTKDIFIISFLLTGICKILALFVLMIKKKKEQTSFEKEIEKIFEKELGLKVIVPPGFEREFRKALERSKSQKI